MEVAAWGIVDLLKHMDELLILIALTKTKKGVTLIARIMHHIACHHVSLETFVTIICRSWRMH